jgi:hypothetical protein
MSGNNIPESRTPESKNPENRKRCSTADEHLQRMLSIEIEELVSGIMAQTPQDR